MKFTASVAGYVTGVRFYKESGMSGQNVGHLWSSTGTLLATATFTNESSSGWQQVNFSSPVAITANTVYIASFSTSGGYFGITTGYFTSGGVTNGPLYAEPNSVVGGDGVYNRPGYFPNVNGNGMNFWADVAFTPSSSGAARPALASRGAVDRAGWVQERYFDHRSIQSPGRFGAASHAGGAGSLRRRMARDNALDPGLSVLSQSHHTGRDTRVLDQEVVLHIRLGLETCERLLK